ncbi:hypothetical protein C4K17_2228 [Pseudomonas chlororaphis subsp. aurantiaca]|nr:hypothetical protein C4K17_2228 [Pseudomonas chlororaphis subsp. aurantiaca]
MPGFFMGTMSLASPASAAHLQATPNKAWRALTKKTARTYLKLARFSHAPAACESTHQKSRIDGAYPHQ